MVKIYLVSNTDWSIFNFRLCILKALMKKKFHIGAICKEGRFFEKIKYNNSIEVLPLNFYERGISPRMDLCLTKELFRLYKRHKPTIVHHFTMKLVIYGTIAARLANVPIVVNTIPGLGYVFVGHGYKSNILKSFAIWTYRVVGYFSNYIFFQNSQDRDIFIKHRVISHKKCGLIPGSGVNINYFCKEEINSNRIDALREELHLNRKDIVVSLISRMLYHKGVQEYVTSAEKFQDTLPFVKFLLIGPVDTGNYAHIPLSQLQAWHSEGKIAYLGRCENIREMLFLSDIVVLPSYYREGVPKILLEAASMGKPIITTNNIGCKDVVEHEENGLLVPINDAEALYLTLKKLIGNPDLRLKYGKKSRERAVSEFDQNIVIDKTLKVYRKLLSDKGIKN